jgi:hypothetical protein
MDAPWAQHECGLTGHAAQGDDAPWAGKLCEPLKHQGTQRLRAGVAVGIEKRGEEYKVWAALLYVCDFARIVNRGAMQQATMTRAALMKAIGMPAQSGPRITRQQQYMPAPTTNPQHLSKQCATLLSSQMIMAENHT